MNNDKPWQWKRVAKDAIRCGDYTVVKEMIFGELTYLAQHGGQLLTAVHDAEVAKSVCYRHAFPVPELEFSNVQEMTR